MVDALAVFFFRGGNTNASIEILKAIALFIWLC